MSGLNNKHKVAALLEARGELKSQEIAEAVGLSATRLSTVRNTVPEYRLLVEKYQKELAERTLDKASELLALFNDEAIPAFRTLQKLHENADRDSVRLGAAKEVLDRSTVAPTKRVDSGGSESGITIQLGNQRMGMIIGALRDVGDEETIDLLEGEGYEEVKDDQPIQAKEAP